MFNQADPSGADNLDFCQINALLKCIAHNIIHRRLIILFLQCLIAIETADSRPADTAPGVPVLPAAYLYAETVFHQRSLRLYIRHPGSLYGNFQLVSFLHLLLVE